MAVTAPTQEARMRSRTAAWLLTVVTVVMICVLLWRVNRGWPVGPKTYAFMAATAVALVAAILAWRRGPAPDRSVP
jgi:uncharacterized membrane protein YjdF